MDIAEELRVDGAGKGLETACLSRSLSSSQPHASKLAEDAVDNAVDSRGLKRFLYEYDEEGGIQSFKNFQFDINSSNNTQFNKIQLIEIGDSLGIRFSNSVDSGVSRQVVLLFKDLKTSLTDEELAKIKYRIQSTVVSELNKENDQNGNSLNVIQKLINNEYENLEIDKVVLISNPGSGSLNFEKNPKALIGATIMNTRDQEIEEKRRLLECPRYGRVPGFKEAQWTSAEERLAQKMAEKFGVLEIKAKGCDITGLVIDNVVLGGATSFAEVEDCSDENETNSATFFNVMVQGVADFSNMKGRINISNMCTIDPVNFVGCIMGSEERKGCDLLFDAKDKEGNIDVFKLQRNLAGSYFSERLFGENSSQGILKDSVSVVHNADVVVATFRDFSVPEGADVFEYRPDWKELLSQMRDANENYPREAILCVNSPDGDIKDSIMFLLLEKVFDCDELVQSRFNTVSPITFEKLGKDLNLVGTLNWYDIINEYCPSNLTLENKIKYFFFVMNKVGESLSLKNKKTKEEETKQHLFSVFVKEEAETTRCILELARKQEES